MANLDTRSKRASSVGILLPFMISPPLPDGTIDQGDRQHIALSYSGIHAAALVTRRLRRELHLHASVAVEGRDRLRVRIKRVQGEGTVYVIPDMSIMIVRLSPRL